MSDSSNSFGEALESMTTNTKQAIGGTIADFTKSAVGQVKGTGNVSGSFTPGQAPASPNLSGGDLFSPDMMQKSQGTPKQQTSSSPQRPNTSVTEAKSPEELEKIQSIQKQLRELHAQNNDIEKEMEKVRREREEKYQQRLQEEGQKEEIKQMDLEQKQKQQDQALLRAQTASERKGGLG